MTDSKDPQQFEAVLSRLDALIKRSHHEAAPLPPPLAGEEDPVPLELALPAEEEVPAPEPGPTTTPFVVIESSPIPILTEIYQGETDQLPTAEPPATTAETLSPALMQVVDLAIRQELAQLQQSLAIRLHREIAALLQQQAAGAPAEPPRNKQD